MSSNQEQQQKGLNLRFDLGIFKIQTVREIFSNKHQKSLDEGLIRKKLNDSNSVSSSSDDRVNRRSSTPTLSKQVGSSRFFIPTKK